MPAATEHEREDAELRAALYACQSGQVDTPLPWALIDALGRLIPCDVYGLMGQDSGARSCYLEQGLDDAGNRVLELREQRRAADEPFWEHYWSSSCSYPDTSGDRTSVTMLSDFCSEREWSVDPMHLDYLVEVRHEMMLCLDDGGSRSARLLFFRTGGDDFTERHRMLLTLLRPHIERAYRTWQRALDPVPHLTPRQLELVEHVARGRTNRQIARELGLSEATVRTHLFNIYERLGVSSRTAAVMRVREQGMVDPAAVIPPRLAAATR